MAGNIKGGSITVLIDLLFDWFRLQIKTKIVSSHAADCKPIKQEVKGTMILPPLVFPGYGQKSFIRWVTDGSDNILFEKREKR